MSRELRELLPELVAAAEGIQGLKQLILYGSFARGEEDRRSDVDLLLVLDTPVDPEKTEVAEKARRGIVEAFARAGSERGVQITLSNLKGVDESFIENVAREGVVLWGKPFF
ncbi:MAG: nucleotidyltransferase domain-containing protein, partial [Methanobacteriota archaeon]